MYFVYIIKSIKYSNKTYIGFSGNIKRRLYYHNIGKSKYTNKFKPWKLIFLICFLDKQKALNFEKYLKTSSGKVFINKRF